MKSTKDFRIKQQSFDSEDSMKRAAKLEPIKKSGKEKRAIYSQLDDEDDDEDEDDEDYEDDFGDEDEFDFGDETLYEVKCPTCGEVITIDEEMLDEGSTKCPNCGEELEFDMDEDEESDDE